MPKLASPDGAPTGDDGVEGAKSIPSDGAPMGDANGEPTGALSSVWFAPADEALNEASKVPALASPDGAPTGEAGAKGGKSAKSIPSDGAPMGDASGEPAGAPPSVWFAPADEALKVPTLASSDGAPTGDDGVEGARLIPSDGAPMGDASGEPAGAPSSVWFTPAV